MSVGCFAPLKRRLSSGKSDDGVRRRSGAARGRNRAAENFAASQRSSVAAGAEGEEDDVSFAKLFVHVDCAEKLMWMDTSFSLRHMKVVKTLDAYVRLKINADREIGCTKVIWKSTGDPAWNEFFVAPLEHPKSYLCVYILDDDDIFSKDSHVSPVFSRQRNCGFIEIPLWDLPLNTEVCGWFKLDHPNIVDSGGSLADRLEKKKGKQEPESVDAGQIKLRLRLESTKKNDFYAHLQPAPKFEKSLPPLDVPQFVEDVMAIKDLITTRVLLPPIDKIKLALSWTKPVLSMTVLLWHWFLCYHKVYTTATFWFLVLLLFWNSSPRERVEKEATPRSPGNLVTGVAHGTTRLFKGGATAVTTLVTKPIEGVARDGIQGLASGVRDGVVGVGVNSVSAAFCAVSDVKNGVMGTMDSMRGPGLQEFQQVLQLAPGLRDLVRGFQPTAASVRASLESVDDLFYWASKPTTKAVVAFVALKIVFSLFFPSTSGTVSGYIYLVVGSLVILAQASLFNLVINAIMAAVAVYSRPKKPFGTCKWFEPLPLPTRRRTEQHISRIKAEHLRRHSQ